MPSSAEPIPAARVQFLLDGAVVALDAVAPDRTVLQVLREDLGRVGTKEGCAEGDCGACTVVMVEATAQGELLQKSVNACIQFAATLDGKALVTVESLTACARSDSPGLALTDRKSALHPVQQAMVDCHGSQCGFCTPGFVMSLFALYRNCAAPSHAQINDALAGNLCRCTGYRPIIDAARAMYALGQDGPPATSHWLLPSAASAPSLRDAASQPVAEQLAALQRTEAVVFEGGGRRFFRPRTLDELAQLRFNHPDARLLAGGTDVGLWVTKQHRDLGDLIYLGAVEGLDEIVLSANGLRIGAAATLEAARPALNDVHPELGELYRRFASLPVRNAGTLVGNLANGSPIGDSMPALIALGAELTLRQGVSTRVVALESFYLGYMKNAMQRGEFIQSVWIPRPASGVRFSAYKISKRFDQDISAVSAGFAISLHEGIVSEARLAFGGMDAIARRAPAAEQALLGAPFDTRAIEAAVNALALDFKPIDDMRASARYRMAVAQNLLRKCLIETAQEVHLRLSEMDARLAQ